LIGLPKKEEEGTVDSKVYLGNEIKNVEIHREGRYGGRCGRFGSRFRLDNWKRHRRRVNRVVIEFKSRKRKGEKGKSG
jgi:hypothetical protein